ncbi:MAG: TolC family protein [Bacteroidetes bacterium]|nr:TolC family protein [Bacteroidota bacterium]
MFKKTLFFALTLFCQVAVFSQANSETKIWTLQECVDYALKNNISVKQSELEKQSRTQDIVNAKGNFLPNVNASASQSFNFGSSIDATGSRVAADFRSNNYSLNASVVLFDGFANINTLNQSKINLEVQNANVEKMKNDISLNVVNAYLQILFAKEQINIAQLQVDISQNEVDRVSKMVDAGITPKGDLLNIKSTLATDEQNLIQAQNTLDISSLRLAQLLQLQEATILVENVALENPNASVINNSSTDIYSKASTTFPEIKAAELSIKSADKSIRISRANYYPSLTLNYGLSTVYQHRQGFVDFYPYSDQLDNNLGHFIGLTLNIPLFNRFQYSTAVAKSRISMEQAQYSLESEKIKLRESIQIAYTDAKTASKTYDAALKAEEANQEAFRYAQERFEVGSFNSFDFNQAKNRLFTAQSQQIRAKYDYSFKLKVLEFYYGIPLVIK